MIDRNWPILSSDINGQQKSIVCHRKVYQLLLADFGLSTKKYLLTMFENSQFVGRNPAL